jgi:hypothetical protein
MILGFVFQISALPFRAAGPGNGVGPATAPALVAAGGNRSGCVAVQP